MVNKEKHFNELFIKSLITEAETSWNIHNSELTGITVIYQDSSLNNVTVSKLEREVKSMIKTVYGDESYPISVAISFGGE